MVKLNKREIFTVYLLGLDKQKQETNVSKIQEVSIALQKKKRIRDYLKTRLLLLVFTKTRNIKEFLQKNGNFNKSVQDS